MVRIEFSTDNAAFDQDRDREIGVILSNILAGFRQGSTSGVIHDTNGNRIGFWDLGED